MIQENFVTLAYRNDEDTDPIIDEHVSVDVAEHHARELLPNLPLDSKVYVARVENVMHMETRIVKTGVTKSTPQVAGHAS